MDVRLLALLLALAFVCIVWVASKAYRVYIARSLRPDLLAGQGLRHDGGILSSAALILGREAPSKNSIVGLSKDSIVSLSNDRPLVLAFTGEYCLPCTTQQHPALEQLRRQIGDALEIQEVDALERADLARRFGVLTVPTTVVLNCAHQVVAINYGVTSAEKLARQVKPLLTTA